MPQCSVMAVFYAVPFRASDLYFSIPKMKASAMQSDRACKIRPDFFRFENPMAQVVRFGPKIRRLGLSLFFKSKFAGL